MTSGKNSAPGEDPGHVAEHVETAERVDGGGDRGPALVAAADVADAGLDRGAARVGGQLGGLGDGVGVDVVPEDLGAFAGRGAA